MILFIAAISSFIDFWDLNINFYREQHRRINERLILMACYSWRKLIGSNSKIFEIFINSNNRAESYIKYSYLILVTARLSIFSLPYQLVTLMLDKKFYWKLIWIVLGYQSTFSFAVRPHLEMPEYTFCFLSQKLYQTLFKQFEDLIA